MFLLARCLILFSFTICNVQATLPAVGQEPESEGATKHVQLTAKVLRHQTAARKDLFDDGSFAVYDATQVLVTSPRGQGGRKLTFYHVQPPAMDSPWQAVGRKVRFLIHPDRLEDPKLELYSGAAQALRVVKQQP